MEKKKTKLQHFHPGETLFREGDKSREMYIIRSGRVRITISKENTDIPITELGKGSFVGEMALISGIPRTASATAVEHVYANVINSEVFENSRYGIPDWIQSIARTLVERIRRTTLMLSDYIAVGDVPALEERKVEETPENFEIQEDEKRSRILLRGYFYGNHIDEVKDLLRKGISRTSGTLTIDFAGVIDVDRDVVEYLKQLIDSSWAKEEKIRFTNIQLIYNKLSELKGVSSLIDSYKMKIKNVSEGEYLIREGEVARSMYVVRTGKFEIYRETEDEVPLPLNIAEPGDVIGEMALIHEGARSATVRALSGSSVYEVEPKEFFHGAYDVPEWFMSVLRGLIDRLRSTNEMLSTITAQREKETEEKEETEALSITVDTKHPGNFTLSGKFTFGNIDYFSAVIRRSMYKGDKNITVDLQNIELMDRQSIKYLLHVYSALKQGGGDLRLIGNKEKITWLYKQKKEEAFVYF